MSTVDRAIPDGERDTILSQACARNLPIEVTLVGGPEPVTLRSRLLKTGESLIIEAPTREGSSVLLHPDEHLNVLMMFGGQRYGFRTLVRDRGRMHLGGEVQVSTLALEYPQKLLKLQRRRFFRVRIPGLQPLVVKCILRKEGEEDSSKDDGFVRFDTSAVDISSGGIAIKVPSGHASAVVIGRKAALVFRLQGFPRPLRLLAEIRNVRTTKESGETVAGLQFVEWHKTLAGRKAINIITRFVVRRQLTELKKRSGME